MKKERAQKNPKKPEPQESPKDEFRLIKNENYVERPKLKPRIKVIPDDLPPAA
jgi:hypothetical protein